MVCSRYLKMFGYDVSALLIKEHKDKINSNHLKTCLVNNVNIFNYQEKIESDEIKINKEKENLKNNDNLIGIFKNFTLVIDAVFGYSFKYGTIKPPYDNIIAEFKELNKINIPIISLDVPSGWNVDSELIDDNLFTPDSIISIGVPKICTKNFKGAHYIGGRFLPELIEDKFEITLVKYEKYCDLDFIEITENLKEVF